MEKISSSGRSWAYVELTCKKAVLFGTRAKREAAKREARVSLTKAIMKSDLYRDFN